MKIFKRLTGVLVFISFVYSPWASASPLNTYYDVLLDGTIAVPNGVHPDELATATLRNGGMLEGHLGTVMFDNNNPEYVPNDVYPDPAYGVMGNSLWVDEYVTSYPDGSERIDIWILSGGENCLALFCNPLDLYSEVIFSIGGLGPGYGGNGLHWGVEGPGAVISDIEIRVTFDGGDSLAPANAEMGYLITPLSQTIFGSGTPSDPLFMQFGLDPHDLMGANGLLGTTDLMYILEPIRATDLHLSFTVSHIPVPAAVWLFGSGLLGLVGMARRKKA